MNRIWISRDSPIPVREQLSAQLLFAILSRRLAPAERLPSVRDLARRVKVHPNTVSAAYRDLAARGWVQRKAGSGVFVCDIGQQDKAAAIDTFVQAWIEEALGYGFSFDALEAAFEKARKRFGAKQEPRKLLVVHPDRNFAGILAAEIQEALGRIVYHSSVEDAAKEPAIETTLLLTTASAEAAVSQLRAEGHRPIPLRSIDELLGGVTRPDKPVLVGIVSRSESVLKWASLLIPALGLAGSDLIQRNPEQSKWRRGLGACDLIAADILAARELPKSISPIVLRLIPESFFQELARL